MRRPPSARSLAASKAAKARWAKATPTDRHKQGEPLRKWWANSTPAQRKARASKANSAYWQAVHALLRRAQQAPLQLSQQQPASDFDVTLYLRRSAATLSAARHVCVRDLGINAKRVLEIHAATAQNA